MANVSATSEEVYGLRYTQGMIYEAMRTLNFDNEQIWNLINELERIVRR